MGTDHQHIVGHPALDGLHFAAEKKILDQAVPVSTHDQNRVMGNLK